MKIGMGVMERREKGEGRREKREGRRKKRDFKREEVWERRAYSAVPCQVSARKEVSLAQSMGTFSAKGDAEGNLYR